MSENFSKERILKNSILLYVRMLFTMWFNLYATRLTLANLGIEDMGVYGVIGSIVSLFTVFTGGITSAVQRFITFELGVKDGKPNTVFCSSLNVIFILSCIMVVLLEIGGLWMLKYKINIPIASRDAAFWVFQLSVLTCIVNTISIPYNALIIAHEKMDAFAVISIVQVILNFFAAYCLSLFENNRLLIYAILLAAISIFIRLLYQIYCHCKFAEAHYHFSIDWLTVKQIGKFTGVSTVSGGLQIIASQGIVFVINLTFGVAINAVYNIALQLKNAVLSFSLNILKAISPQITKTYANNEIDAHKKLVINGSKMEVFFIYFIMIPFLFRTEYIMKLWLGNIPEYIVPFVQCTVFLSLTYAAFEPIRTAVLATNKIKEFMLIPDTIYLLVIPTAYVVCRITSNPISLIVILVSFEIFICVIRILLATHVTVFRLSEFLKQILWPCLTVAIFDCIICYGLSFWFSVSILGLIGMIIINSIFLLVLIFALALSCSEKKRLLIISKVFVNKMLKAVFKDLLK